MHRFRFCATWASLLFPAALLAQDITTEGTLSVAAGGTLLDGDRPAFQRIMQQKKDGYGGLEDFRLTREDKTSSFKFNARAILGEDAYKLGLRYEKNDHYYFDAGYQRFRVYYDGSAGWFSPTNTSVGWFNEDLSLTRSKLWAEFGAFTANKTLIKLRYERSQREGTKDSTHWGDTGLIGSFGTRNIAPTYLDLDEVTDTVSLDIGNETQEAQKWNVGASYSENKLNNKKLTRRRPGEPTVDRMQVTKDQTEADIFTVHGYYLQQVSDKLTVSGGAMRTNLDTTLKGSRIFGQSLDPVFDPQALRRQYHDEGYATLGGDATLKQTVLNLNAVYVPRKDWSVRPSIRFENVHDDATSEFDETNVGNAPGFVTAVEGLEGEHKKKFNEFSESVEVRYTGKPDWTYNAKAEWVQGSGNLDEWLGEGNTTNVARKDDFNRKSQKYSFGANWYARPGLTFAAQYYFKGNMNDYKNTGDSTSNASTSGDRYPNYIANQDFEVNDFNIRMSWRPVSMLNLVTRYDNQQAKVISGMEGLAMGNSSQLKSNIISQTVTWSPTNRLYLTGGINVTFDQMHTPATPFVQHGDNNYVNGSIGGGYAVAKQDDLYLDYNWFNASNWIDNSLTALPYGLSQRTNAGSLTWVRRQSEHLVYTMKYSYVTNRDTTFGGRNNFDAHVIYAKVQYRF